MGLPGQSGVRACAGRAMTLCLQGASRAVSYVEKGFSIRRFSYTLALISALGAKVVHIYSHSAALAAFTFQQWGYTFLAQDFAFFILLRLVLDVQRLPGQGPCSPSIFVRFAGVLLTAFVTAVSVSTIVFFVVSGSEIHWSNASVASDAAGRALLLSGLSTLCPVLGGLCLISWLLQDFGYGLGGVAVDIVSWPLRCAYRVWRHRSRRSGYAEAPQDDLENGQTKGPATSRHVLAGLRAPPWRWIPVLWALAYAVVFGGLLAQVIFCLLRPHGGAISFMSWTPALLPFVDFQSSTLRRLTWLHGSGALRDWDARTALGAPIHLSWLPPDTVLAGFEDWYENKTHYNAAMDPLRISNLDQELLVQLRGQLRQVPIRHVVFVVLESTRQDVFPIKKDSLPLQRLRETWSEREMPPEALEHLAALTPTARRLTNDLDDGFQRPADGVGPRGGVSFSDAYTTSTYTLKSLVGTLCGISPLVADFNLEYRHNVYQPCLPHIFAALSSLAGGESRGGKQNSSREFTAYPWKSSFMLSATLKFDNSGPLMTRLGFPHDALVDREYLRSPNARFGPVTLPDVNYFGFEEDPLADYIQDAFTSAKENNERVFLTHLTSTSHHPWNLPAREKHVKLSNGLENLAHYVSTIGYDDRWLGKVLEVLEDQGVANETLVVLLGDHGLSLPENDNPSATFNANAGNNHVPLILSHPKLPPITVDSAVSSLQVLPTVLDLLIETGSLDGTALQAARELVRNYEGQSLVRPVRASSPADDGEAGLGNWQFTVVNPGRAMVGVRDARHKTRRLVVPTVDNVEWRFSDLAADPREADPVLDFDLAGFLAKVGRRHGPDVAQWVTDGAFVTRWWVEENSKRWRYGPYAV